MKSIKFFLSSIVLSVMVLVFSIQARANEYTFKFSDSFQYTSNDWSGGPDWDMFITVDNGGVNTIDTFYMDDIQRWELVSGTYTQTWDLGSGDTLSFMDSDQWKITYDGYNATWSINDFGYLPTSQSISSFQMNDIRLETWFQPTPCSVPPPYECYYQNLSVSGFAIFYQEPADAGTPRHYVGTLVPEPISFTLFIVGGATLGLRRFRKKFKK